MRGGDSLSSIAQSVWGDAAMWYLIADANGLSGQERLVDGQVLVIPNKVTNIHNNATTFRPYNPGDAIGRVDPTLPEPPPPPAAAKKGCGGIGVILMVVVAVVVSVLTAGAALAALAPALGAFAPVAAGAIGAAAGSVASQTVGMVTGNVESFSWKAVGQAAISGAVSAGIAQGISALASSSSASQSVQEAAKWLKQTDNLGAAMTRAAITSSVSQAMQGKWSWKEVGASTVGAGAGYMAGEALGDAFKGFEGGQTLQLATTSAVGSWASSQVMGYNSAETRARLSQAFISGLGQGIGQALSAGEGNVVTSKDYRNGSDMDSDRYVAASAWNYQNGADIDSSDMDEYERNERELKARAVVRDTSGNAPVTSGTWGNVEGYRSRVGGAAVGTGRAGLLGDAQASIAMAQSPEHAYTVAPSVEPGVYGFESGTNVFGRFQAGWYTSPLDQVGLLGENRFRLPTAVVTTNHGLAVEAWQQYADRIEAARPQSTVAASTFLGGFGQTMGAAWHGFAGGVANLASDLANPLFAEGGVKARSAFFRDVDRMGYWRAGLLRGVEGTLSPWMLGGSIVDSSTGTVGSLWRGDMAGAGRNFATLTLDSAAAAAMVMGGRAGLSARTSFKPLGWVDVAEGFVPARFGNTAGGRFYKVASDGIRGEVPLNLEQRAQVNNYLSNFDMDGVNVRWVDDRNLNTAYGDMFGERILNIGSDIVPGNVGAGTLTANSRVSINGTLAHEIVGHMEAGIAGQTQDLVYMEEAQASIRAARFAPDLTSTERFTLLRDAITRLQNAPGGPVSIGDVRDSLYIWQR